MGNRNTKRRKAYHRAYNRVYYKKNRAENNAYCKKYRREHIVYLAAYSKEYRKKNKLKLQKYARAYSKKNGSRIRASQQIRKRRVMDAYGKICQCCGESNIGFLTIDHIKNNGAAHRRKVGSGNAFYHWLIKHKFPPGYQVLCYNCNIGRARQENRRCPHKTH